MVMRVDFVLDIMVTIRAGFDGVVFIAVSFN